MSMLEVKDLVVSYGAIKALQGISFKVDEGEIISLIGSNGAGKTTLLNALIGYEKADATILLTGEDVYKDYKRVKYKIGFVPQQNLIRGKDSVIRTVDDAARVRVPKNVSGKERKNPLSASGG